MAVTPTPFNFHAGATGGGTAYGTLVAYLPNGTQAGNTIICHGQYGDNGAITPSLTDENSDAFTNDIVHSGGGSGQTVFIAHSTAAATTGSHIITVTYSGANATNQKLGCYETNNTAGHDGGSACSGATGSSTTPSSGSITTTVANDLIDFIAVDDQTGSVTSWTAGSGFALWENDRGYGSGIDGMGEWQIDASTGSTSPTATVAPSTGWNAAACAFKAQAAGNPQPAGMYVNCVANYNIGSKTSGFKIGAPCGSGNNLLVLTSTDSPGNGHITGVSGSVSGTWTIVDASLPTSSGSGIMDMWNKVGATVGPADLLTITTSAAFSQGEISVKAITGADSSSPLDTSPTGVGSTTCASGLCTLTGTQSSGGSLTAGGLTPSTANGVVIYWIGVNSPKILGNSSPGLSDLDYSVDMASLNELMENNGYGHTYYSSASAISPVFTTGGAAVQGWRWAGAAFKTAAAGGVVRHRAQVIQ